MTFASVGSALLVVFFGPPWDSTREKNHQAADDKPRFLPVFGGPDWKRLYDGKSYAGWKATGNSNAGRGEFVLFPGGAVDTLEKMPRNFHLRMEVNLFRGEGTVRFHAQPRVGEAGPTVGDEDWLLLFTESKSKVNCELLTRKVNQRMKLNSAGATGLAQVGEWTYVEIVAKDQYTDVFVNGVLCLTIQHIDNGPAAGVLSLWNTGRGDSQIAFRNIEVKDLTTHAEPGWVELYNGKDLTGWIVPVDVKGKVDWHVDAKSGHLVGVGTGNIFSERDDFTDFHLKAEVGSFGDANGIFFRVGTAPGADVTDGYEALIGGPRGTVLRTTIGADKSVRLEERAGTIILPKIGPAPGVLFPLEIIARGNNFVVKFNGETVANCWDDKPTHRKGRIVLRVQDGSTVSFKKIEIKELPTEEPGWAPLFNGKDWTGWKSSGTPWVIHGTGEIIADRPGYAQTEKLKATNFLLRLEAKINRGQVDIGFNINDKTGWRLNLADNTQNLGMLDGLLWANVAGKSLEQSGVTRNIGKVGDWIKIEVRALDKQATVFINGTKVIELTNNNFTPSPGEIGLTVAPLNPETKDGAASFRKIEIKELPPEEPGWVPLFNGKNLTGWREVYDKKKYATPPWDIVETILVLKGGKDQPTGYLRTEKQYREFHLRFDYKHTSFAPQQSLNASHVYWGLQGPDDPSTLGWRILTPEKVEPKREDLGGGLELNTYTNKKEGKFFTGGIVFFGKKGINKNVEWPIVYGRDTPADKWNRAEIISKFGELELRINGASTIAKGYQPILGHLGLFCSEQGLHLRKIEIKELPATLPGAVLLEQMQERLLKAETIKTKFAGIWSGGSKFEGTFALSVKAKSLNAKLTLEGRAPYTKSDRGNGVTGKANRALATIGYGGAFVPCFLLENFADDLKEQDLFFTDPRQMDASPPRMGGIAMVGGREAQVVTFDLTSKNGLLTIQNRVWIDTKRMLPVKWMTTTRRGKNITIATEEFESVELSEQLAEPGWLPLFNGKDLTGWRGSGWSTGMEGAEAYLVRSGPSSRLETKQSFENYELRLEYRDSRPRAKGTGSAPFARLHVNLDDLETGEPRFLLVDIYDDEVQLTRHARASFRLDRPQPAFKAPDKGKWNQIRVVCRDKKIAVFINDQLVVSGQNCSPHQGRIGLEADSSVHFRRIEIKDLPTTK